MKFLSCLRCIWNAYVNCSQEKGIAIFSWYGFCILNVCHSDSDYFCHSLSCALSMGLCLSTVMIFINYFDSFKCDQWVFIWFCIFDITVPVNSSYLLFNHPNTAVPTQPNSCTSLPFYRLHYLAHVKQLCY